MIRQTLTLNAAEVRFANDEATGVIAGYAAIFNELVPSYGEMVKRGAFKKTLAEHKAAGTRPVMLWAHDQRAPIGVWSDITEDERGLKVTGKLITETSQGADALALLKAGAINGLSIGFIARGEERLRDGTRVLTDVQLEEISLVAIPAAKGARITSVRSSADMAGLAALTEAARRAAQAFKTGHYK